MVERILDSLLAESTRRQYNSILANFRTVASEFGPTSEESWLKWIQKRLSEMSSYQTVAHIMKVKSALALKGVDLVVDNPKLNRLLTRIAARLRKFGKGRRSAVK